MNKKFLSILPLVLFLLVISWVVYKVLPGSPGTATPPAVVEGPSPTLTTISPPPTPTKTPTNTASATPTPSNTSVPPPTDTPTPTPSNTPTPTPSNTPTPTPSNTSVPPPTDTPTPTPSNTSAPPPTDTPTPTPTKTPSPTPPTPPPPICPLPGGNSISGNITATKTIWCDFTGTSEIFLRFSPNVAVEFFVYNNDRQTPYWSPKFDLKNHVGSSRPFAQDPDGDPNTGERTWNGGKNDFPYYLRIINESETDDIQYCLALTSVEPWICR